MLISFYFVVVSSLSGFMTVKLRLFLYTQRESTFNKKKNVPLQRDSETAK